MSVRKWPGLLVLLAALTAEADYSNTVMSFHPAAYWPLNETNVPAADAATNQGTLGAGGNGYYVDGVTHSAGGALAGSGNTSANFYGTGGRVAVPFSPALGLQAPFTVEAWIMPWESPPSTDPSAVLACVNFVGIGRLGWLVYQYGTQWNLRFGSTNGYTFDLYGTNTIQAWTWQHLAVVYDGTNASLYVNGVKDLSGAVSSFTPNNGAPLEIGGVAAVSRFNMMTGDEVAVYTNALSDEILLAHYQNGTDYEPDTSYDQLVLSNHPIIYLRLDEPSFTAGALPAATNRGSLGASAEGVYQPGSLPGVAGVAYTGLGAGNRGCKFNGLQSYLDLGTAGGLDLLGPMTLAAWVKGNPADSRLQCILGKGDGSWSLAMTAGGLPVFSDGQANPDATGSVNVNDGKWHHLAGVYDGAELILYVDGLSNAAVNASNPIEGSSSYAAMGRAPDYADRFFAGSVDEAAIFTNALTPAQVRQIYESANVPPTITRAPLAQTVAEGLSFTLSAAAIGTPPLTYQWRKNGTNLPGQTGTELIVSNSVAANAGTYAVQVTNAYGLVMSPPAVITIQGGQPVIYDGPQSRASYTGSAVSFSVHAGGTPPLDYQWFVGATLIVGATASNHVVAGVELDDAGNYICLITNVYGSVFSPAASLTVAEAPADPGAVAVLADGPAGFWRLGEASGTTAYDYVGAHHGEYTNVVLGQPGRSLLDTDTAVAFGPARDSLVIGIGGINFGTTGTNAAFSVEAWVKCPRGQAGNVGIVGKGPAGAEQFSLDLGTNGGYRFLVRDAGGQARVAQSAVVPDNTWQHVVGVCNEPGGQLRLYVNGVSAASAGISAGVLSVAHPVAIGSRQSGADTFDLNLNGIVDEVAIYGYALGGTQVAAHFQAHHGTNLAPVATAPASATNYVTLPAAFSVEAAGTPPLSYRWRFNGVPIPGATNRAYEIASLHYTNAGAYSVVVTNRFGTNQSPAADLVLLPVPFSLDLTAGLVMNLKFDSNFVDWTGRGNDGTNVGATSFVAGPIGSGALHYSSDGGSSFNYVTLGLRPDLQFSSNVNFSVAYWIRYPSNDLSGEVPILGNAVESTCHPGWVLAQNAGSWTWSLGDLQGNLVPAVGHTNSVNDGRWHHLAHTFDRTGSAITYLDSVPVDSRRIAHAGGSCIGDVDTGELANIGQDPTGAYDLHAVSADLDDLGVWQRVLTPLEVAGIYAVGIHYGTSLAPLRINISTAGNQIQLSWQMGVLQSADEVTGEYEDVPGATSPHPVTPSGPWQFFRLRQ